MMPTTTTAAMTATTGMNNDGYNGNDGNNNNNNVNSDACSAKQSCFAIYSKDKKSLLFSGEMFCPHFYPSQSEKVKIL